MKQTTKHSITVLLVLLFIFWLSAVVWADNDPCIISDNGSGTIDLPADCPYTAPDGPMYIIEGLPSNSTIELEPTLVNFFCNAGTPCSAILPPSLCETSGGSLGGNIHCFEATLDLVVSGTGDLEGFSRHLAVPVNIEIHTAPRNPGDTIQAFLAEIVRFDGILYGDPDFCSFRVTAGSDSSLPSPGGFTLTELPSGDFNVDSFFDITYQIEFQGCPGSPLDDYQGTTTGSVRLKQGSGDAPPFGSGACCRPDGICFVVTESYCEYITGTYSGDDSECSGDSDGDGYDDLCYEPGTCLAPNNGGGTVDLPADCPYLTIEEDPMLIIDGLPAGSTIELDASFENFICNDPGMCSSAMPPGTCEIPGGTLGGDMQCFEATLKLDVTGTGDLTGFNRTLWVPVFCEIHTGPRTPGEPVQEFPGEIYYLFGQLYGDPDFCEFIVRGGSDNGLPSPGEFSLVLQIGDDFTVDSFFDITYQIQFQGCPGSVLEGLIGTTTATTRWYQGAAYLPGRGACCLSDGSCIVTTEENCVGQGYYQGDETICLGDGNSDDVDDACPYPPYCITPDNGTGTVDLPANCPYKTLPDNPMEILDGLPPNSTLELAATLEDFICDDPDVLCSSSIPDDICEIPGGMLGGHLQCFQATLKLDVTGTGDFTGFNRTLWVPVFCEIHTGPRTPGEPVQEFPGEIYYLFGQLYGDPDFCEFIVRGGSDYGLPSPGEFSLVMQTGGDFDVESFFDITYQIQFQGCPGSMLEGLSGTTTATTRWYQGRESGYAYLPGDANMHLGLWPPRTLGGDVVFLLSSFKGSPSSLRCLLHNPAAVIAPTYFWASADVNGDCLVIGSDVVRLVAYFRSQGVIQTCSDYPPAYPPIPPSAPTGWPNCETPPAVGRVIPVGLGK